MKERTVKENYSDLFRELPPVELWIAKLKTEKVKQKDLENILRNLSQDFNFYGFFSQDEGETEYHFSRYPRHKYGIPSIDNCDVALERLAHQVSTFTQIVETSRITGSGVRVLLGLLEGYNDTSITHSMNEVFSVLDTTCSITPVTIFSVGPWGSYSEDAALLEGDSDTLPSIYELGLKFKQERFTVEDFDNGQAYVVETPYCSSPDPEPLEIPL